jgi:hypothetical protein
MIDKGDILSIHCKLSLRGPKSVRKVDGLSLIFIDFYFPALIPYLSSNETLLQLPENMTLFAVCHIYGGVISEETEIDTRCLGHFIYILCNVGDRMDPCDIPACTFLGVDISPLTETLNFL